LIVTNVGSTAPPCKATRQNGGAAAAMVSAKMARTQPDTETARQHHLNTNSGIARHSFLVRPRLLKRHCNFAPDGLIICTRHWPPSERRRASPHSATLRIEYPITIHYFRAFSAMPLQYWL
jgi:hypothetical protein